MKKRIIVAVVALGIMLIPASPASAGHCKYPFVRPDPLRDPHGYVEYQVALAKYDVCWTMELVGAEDWLPF